MQQHVVIIGGTSGIGLAAAQILLRQKFRLTVVGRDTQRLARATKVLQNEAETASVDAANPNAVAALFASIGRFDHLVLAFGSNKGLGPFATIGIEDVRLSFTEKVFP